MAMEQCISASGMEQAQAALASHMAALQTALASLIDLVVSVSFRQRSILSFQTNFHWWVSVDDLVASSFPRALLASFWRQLVSLVGVPLLGPGVSGMGERAVGISSRGGFPHLSLIWGTHLGRCVHWTRKISQFGGQRHEHNHGIQSLWG